jgi:uncharacterized protein YndB with AHSA1/START domain
VKIERSIDLPCAPEEAWDVLTGWERQTDWMLDADGIDLRSEHRAGLGVRLHVRTRLFQVPAFVEPMEVVGWEPPHRLEVVHGAPVRGRGTWTLTPIDGGTRFTWTEEVALGVPLIGAAAAGLYRPVARWLIGRSQRALKALIVASGPRRA